jgi:hypothetical protein
MPSVYAYIRGYNNSSYSIKSDRIRLLLLLDILFLNNIWLYSSKLSCHTTNTMFPLMVVISGFDESALLELRGTAGKNVVPLSLLFVNKKLVFALRSCVSASADVSSSQTTYMLLDDISECGLNQLPGLLLKLIGSPKILPLFSLFVKNISD